MNVPLPERLFPSILSTLRAQLALTDLSSRVRVCSSSEHQLTFIIEMNGLCNEAVVGNNTQIYNNNRYVHTDTFSRSVSQPITTLWSKHAIKKAFARTTASVLKCGQSPFLFKCIPNVKCATIQVGLPIWTVSTYTHILASKDTQKTFKRFTARPRMSQCIN